MQLIVSCFRPRNASLLVIFLAGCQSHLPPFTEAQREKNPFLKDIGAHEHEEDRQKFYQKYSKLLEARIQRARSLYSILELGPHKEAAATSPLWWEDFWKIDFEEAFVHPEHPYDCLHELSRELSRPAAKYGETTALICSRGFAATVGSWDKQTKSDVARLLTLRPTFYSSYQKVLHEELRAFDEVYRMQFADQH